MSQYQIRVAFPKEFRRANNNYGCYWYSTCEATPAGYPEPIPSKPGYLSEQFTFTNWKWLATFLEQAKTEISKFKDEGAGKEINITATITDIIGQQL